MRENISANPRNDGQFSKAIQVRRRIWSKLPKDYKRSFWYYKRNFFHCVSYVGVFICSYRLQEYLNQNPPKIYSLVLGNKKYEVGNIVKYLLSPVISWSVIGILLLGHEASHNTFAPSNNKLGKLINYIIKNTFPDWFAIGDRFSFRRSHDKHHKYVNTKSDTEMVYLDYNLGVFGEILHAMNVIIQWNLYDTKELFNFNINIFNQPNRYLWKPYLLFTFCIRLLFYSASYPKFNNIKHGVNIAANVLLQRGQRKVNISNATSATGILSRFGNLYKSLFTPRIGIALVNMFTLSHFFNLIFFLPHATPVITSKKNATNDEIVYVLRNTWDLYPSNSLYDQFQQFIHCGGATPHCGHHCMPFVPRSLLHIVSKEISIAYPKEYRPIKTIKDEFNLWKTRKVFGFRDEIPETIQMRNKLMNQVIAYDSYEKTQ